MKSMDQEKQDLQLKLDLCDKIIAHLVNSALNFDKEKYNTIYIHFEDNYKGHLAYNLALIMRIFLDSRVTLVTDKNVKKCRFFNRKFFKESPFLKIIKNKKEIKETYFDETTLYYSTDIHGYNYLFRGFSDETLKMVAELTYYWNDDKRAYLKGVKERKKQCLKEN